MKNSNLRSGQTTPISGQYAVIGPRGGYIGEVTSTKGNPLPPTPKPNQTFTLVDKTRGY